MRKLLIFIALTVLLSSSQAVAVSNVNNAVIADGFNDDSDYSTAIDFVGTSALDSGEITMSEWGTYDVNSDDAYLSLIFKVNFTGYETFVDANNYTGENYFVYADDNVTVVEEYQHFYNSVGQFDVIVDGKVTTSGAFQGASGATVVLSGYGDHVVAFLYYGYEGDNFVYATDSAVVRVRETGATFGAYTTLEVPFQIEATDSAVAGEDIVLTNENADYVLSEYYGYGYGWFTGRNGEKQLALEDKADMRVEVAENDAGQTTSLYLAGTYDTTGTRDFYNDDVFYDLFDFSDFDPVTSTVGRMFIMDATGLRLSDGNVDSVSVIDNEGSTTFVGSLVVADGGSWFSMYSGAGDWEGLAAPEAGGYTMISYDFWSTTVGTFVGGDIEVGTEDAPGFSGFDAALGLLSLGIIAFVIPRKFRK